MNQYETVFILTPVLSDEQTKEAVKRYEDFIAKNGGKMVHQEKWGMRKFAYPIQKKSSGFYHLFEYTNDGQLIAELEVLMKRDERIMRFLTVKLDKHAVIYNEKKRKKKKEAAKAKSKEKAQA